MLDFDELEQKLNNSFSQMEKNISHLGTMAKDAERVSIVAKNANIIIKDIDRQFETATKLTKVDIAFLFLAAALQVGRQVLLPNNSFRLSAVEGDKLIKNPLKKVIKDKNWQDILLGSVPYDAVKRADSFPDSTGISGSTHRYKTLGHDPILGWIFGPVNIISDSLTKSNFVETYSVTNMEITGLYPDGTIEAFNNAFSLIADSFKEDNLEKKLLLPSAVIKQAIHFGSDCFTKQGLPIPLISSFGTTGEKISKDLLLKFKINTYSIVRSMTVAIIINSIIEIIHKLFYNENTDRSPDLYKVRTEKVKQEFLEKEFYKDVMGDKFDF